MKKIAFVSMIAAIVFFSCQPKTKVIPVDLNAAKDAVTVLLDKFSSGMKSKDANALAAIFTDDCLVCGSDAKELLNKTDWTNMMVQSFADTAFKVNYNIDKREIRVSADGNSAVALEQMFFNVFSEKMPVRIVYHLLKDNSGWKFDFASFSFIPNNEDIEKLNNALK
jgi:uncharacterized protein (TIGR02246 family)